MSTLGTTALTLVDWAKRTDASGKVSKIVEILNETNEVIDDAMFVEGNLPTGHKTTVRSGLPSATWRLLNYGVQPSKSRTVQVTDACGMLEAYSEVDKALADLNGNTSEFRLSEDRAFLEAMNQEFSDTLFYGNSSTDPEEFTGLAPRFNSTTAENGVNIVNASGSGSDNTSVWLVCWGDLTCHGIFPKGSKAGFSHTDLGQQTLFDSATPAGRYEGYRSHYKWDCGLTLRDWRYVVRIANIDVSDLTKNAGSGFDLIDGLSQAIELLPGVRMGRPVFYCNRTVKSFLRRQIANRVASNLTLDNVSGKHVMAFDGIPVKRCDSILSTEAAIV
jgi:hypothetical protein